MKWVAGPVNAHSAADRETPTRSRGLGFPTPGGKAGEKEEKQHDEDQHDEIVKAAVDIDGADVRHLIPGQPHPDPEDRAERPQAVHARGCHPPPARAARFGTGRAPPANPKRSESPSTTPPGDTHGFHRRGGRRMAQQPVPCVKQAGEHQRRARQHAEDGRRLQPQAGYLQRLLTAKACPDQDPSMVSAMTAMTT